MNSAPAPPTAFISVIIPALNEAEVIRPTLRSVNCPSIKHEVIVADGGSADGTVTIAEAAGARIVHSQCAQRAAQMNLGAGAARGEVLLFLHADTRLGEGALRAIDDALRDPFLVGGAFARRYDSPSLFLRATCWLAEVRSRLCGWHLGDQAIFARADTFQRCGRFAEMDQFEDLTFSRALARCGRVVTLRPPVLSAARRFAQDGPLLRTTKDVLLTCRYLAHQRTSQSNRLRPAWRNGDTSESSCLTNP